MKEQGLERLQGDASGGALQVVARNRDVLEPEPDECDHGVPCVRKGLLKGSAMEGADGQTRAGKARGRCRGGPAVSCWRPEEEGA